MVHDARLRLLVLDDDALLRGALVRVVRHLGFDVDDFGSGAEAVAHFARASALFTAAILDVEVPDMSGEQVAAQLLAHAPTLPVLFVTGAPYLLRPETIARERTLVIAKPWTVEQLKVALRAITGDAG